MTGSRFVSKFFFFFNLNFTCGCPVALASFIERLSFLQGRVFLKTYWNTVDADMPKGSKF